MESPQQLTSSRKGRIAEAGVPFIAIRKGWDAYIPTGDGAKADMVLIDAHGTPIRVQVKWGNLEG